MADISREARLQRAKDAINHTEKFMEDYRGTCEECMHFRKESFEDKCASPIVKASSILVDQGYNRDRYQDADYQRGSGMDTYGVRLCGPKGTLFEQRTNDNYPSLWDRIKTWLAN